MPERELNPEESAKIEAAKHRRKMRATKRSLPEVKTWSGKDHAPAKHVKSNADSKQRVRRDAQNARRTQNAMRNGKKSWRESCADRSEKPRRLREARQSRAPKPTGRLAMVPVVPFVPPDVEPRNPRERRVIARIGQTDRSYLLSILLRRHRDCVQRMSRRINR